MVLIALGLTAAQAFTAWCQVPTAFIPNEDQGYGLVAVQLSRWRVIGTHAGNPGASLGDRQAAARRCRRDRHSPAFPFSTITPTLANAGIAYVTFKPWSERGEAKGQDLRSIMRGIQGRLSELTDGMGFVLQ